MDVRILEYLSRPRRRSTRYAYLGTGNGAVLAVGSTARITGRVGVKGSLPVGEKFRFAATLDMTLRPGLGLLIADGPGTSSTLPRPGDGCQIDLG